MIPEITEVNFGPDTAASYATLHEATVTLVDMGERTISTQVRIDGDVVPNFSGWELQFRGERFVLPVKDPQAAKDNTTRNSLVDLTFRSWAIEELKRYYYFQPAAINSNTAIADQYQASVRMTLANFIANFQSVLKYYWGDQIQMQLYPGVSDTNSYLVEIDHLKVWDVLTRFYEIFHQRWEISTMPQNEGEPDITMISVGYPSSRVGHIFKYGYDGGLLRFERQVQDPDITNVLLGRGGEKNLPYRYFKKEDPNNPSFRADPDAIPELQNIYFDRLRDINFRWYVRGWMHNPNRDTSGDEAWDPGHVFPTYTISSDSPYYWAYQKGLTDTKFNPVEYVKDDASITKYGEHWGALDDTDDIYPTIQGRTRDGLGRIDEIVEVSPILTDDIKESSQDAAVGENLDPMLISGRFFRTAAERDASGWTYGKSLLTGNVLVSTPFTIPEEKKGVITAQWVFENVTPLLSPDVFIDTVSSKLRVRKSDGTVQELIDWDTAGDTSSPTKIDPGTYRLEAVLNIAISTGGLSPAQEQEIIRNGVEGTFGVTSIVVNIVSAQEGKEWKPTFDIWVKDIWGIPKDPQEPDEDFAERVWLPILGDRQRNEAKVVFSSGLLSTASDYEFTIIGVPVYDTSKTYHYPSMWRITLQKSDAEYQSTGKYIPSAEIKPVAGDTFFFIGIDMPEQYVEWAEEELNTYKAAQLSEIKDIAPTWVVTLDKVRANTLEGYEVATIASMLAPGKLVNTQDVRFAPAGVQLYIQSITYRWEEPSEGNPYIVPDIEIVLSDKVVSSVGSVARLQGQVNSIQSEYVRADQVEETVRRIGAAIYLKKTGESDKSDSPTVFTSKLTSDNFRQGGVGGAGWGIYKSNQASLSGGASQAIAEGETAPAGESVLEFDKVIVRKELQVNTLVVNQISAIAGKEVLSAARIEVNKVIVDEVSGYYLLYFDQKQGSIVNTFSVGDIALCQRFNEEWDTTPTKYYRMVVTESEADHITLSRASRSGAGVPDIGDVVVQYGHISNTARQYVIVRDVVGGGYEQMISGLTATEDQQTHQWSYTSGNEYYFAGQQPGQYHNKPRWFVGDANGEHAEFENGQLNIKGRLQVLGESGSYSDLGYLADALPKKGATLVQGGLILSSTIQLGQQDLVAFKIYSGLNGMMTPGALGQGIAAWYGGEMLEKFDWDNMSVADKAAHQYAKTLFRFDGSGYLASNKIKWNADGTGEIPGVEWTANNDIIISSSVVFRGNNNQLIGLVDAVKALSSMFVREGSGTSADPYRIKALYGLYSESFISAGGLNANSGGGGGGGGGTTVQWGTYSNGYRSLIVEGDSDSVAAHHNVAVEGHAHGDLYYTKSEVDTALAGKASASDLTSLATTVAGKADASDLNSVASDLSDLTVAVALLPTTSDVSTAITTAVNELNLGDASHKGVATIVNSQSTNDHLATAQAVWNAINTAVNALNLGAASQKGVATVVNAQSTNADLSTAKAVWDAIVAFKNTLGGAAWKGVAETINSSADHNHLATALAVKNAIADREWFVEYDLPDNGGKALKLNDAKYVGMFAEGWVSAGGLGSGSGGGGGTAVQWTGSPSGGFQELTVEGDHTHIVALQGHGHSTSESWLSSALAPYVTSTVLNTTLADYTTLTTLANALLGYVPKSAVASKGSASMPIYFDASSVPQEITSLDLLSKNTGYVKANRFYLSSAVYFELDNGNVHLVVDAANGKGFYVDGFVSAGGIGSGGSAGGAAQWTSPTGGTYRELTVEGSAETVALSGHGHSTSDISGLGTAATRNAGVAGGLAELDSNGKVPSSQLPSYVDDVLEYSSRSAFPATGETGKIYVATDTNKTYRWSGSGYTEISASLALGTTSSTAFRGDYGQTAYTHATDSDRETSGASLGFYKFSITSEGHVGDDSTAVTKSDLVSLIGTGASSDAASSTTTKVWSPNALEGFVHAQTYLKRGEVDGANGLYASWSTANSLLTIGVGSNYHLPTTSEVSNWSDAYDWVNNYGHLRSDWNEAYDWVDNHGSAAISASSLVLSERLPHYVLIGPATGSGSADRDDPTWRALVKADMPSEVALTDTANTFTEANYFSAVLPRTSGSYNLGSSSHQWGNLYLKQNGNIYFNGLSAFQESYDSGINAYYFVLGQQTIDTHDLYIKGKNVTVETYNGSAAMATLCLAPTYTDFYVWNSFLSTPAREKVMGYNPFGLYLGKSLYFDLEDFSIQGKSGGNWKNLFYYTDAWKQIIIGNDTAATHDTFLMGRTLVFRAGGNDSNYTKLDINGSRAHFYVGVESDSYITAGGVNSASDIRLKKNLRAVDLTVAQIAEAPAVTFEWVNDGERSAGSIAQYWQSLLPENVMTNSNGMLSMEYGNIALLSAITVARKVETQEEKIKRLETRVAELEARLNS